jgi:hypothetical protein
VRGRLRCGSIGRGHGDLVARAVQILHEYANGGAAGIGDAASNRSV